MKECNDNILFEELATTIERLNIEYISLEDYISKLTDVLSHAETCQRSLKRVLGEFVKTKSQVEVIQR